ncbi:hypothetical protein CD116_05940 [Staphylococcus schweitzeri]|uniref:Membrane protein n=1 Tax=Staphylococcus schweitzeri TaxID=1654388 RepID=A0A2K4AIQ4_9STAP|nr:hypothetical protein [Staphylococcus schweitzeri]MBE2129969.1 hypothetical protein [Staphylococcus schweitzeri]PNZ49848.1 hypothetical protein CD116_05940 [Staphylococcus schweitzeri]CDR29390.1 membrane protein [Staphylococcus schweitzeri]CDR52285.1 membrane protein [Staphylococcus schweitzeri]CDR55219.1 membrane protein [Staphylococcus schweitzeri]
MKNIQLNAINLVITIIFIIFNIMITYNKGLDDLCWLLPGIIICGSILIISFTIAMITKFWLSEILFFINIVLVLYYIYPIFYDFID